VWAGIAGRVRTDYEVIVGRVWSGLIKSYFQCMSYSLPDDTHRRAKTEQFSVEINRRAEFSLHKVTVRRTDDMEKRCRREHLRVYALWGRRRRRR